MDKDATTTPRHGILSLTIKELPVLHSAYMPFVENGGLFIPTSRQYQLDDEVFILLGLMDEAERLPITGRVVWLTPSAAQGNRIRGIGIQFAEKDNPARLRIEKYLASQLSEDRLTHTL